MARHRDRSAELQRRPLFATGILLPSTADTTAPPPQPCVVCHGTPAPPVTDDGDRWVPEFTDAFGMKGMSLDNNLCLECAVQVWRAVNATRPDFLAEIIEALARYPPTAAAVAEWKLNGKNACPPVN